MFSFNGTAYTATDVTGRYTATNLVAGTYAIMPSKPVHHFVPTSRTVDLQADQREQNFAVEPDLGFRPEQDGYSFDNPGQATPDCLAFQRSFGGINIQCSGDQPQPQYLSLFERYKFSCIRSVR